MLKCTPLLLILLFWQPIAAQKSITLSTTFDSIVHTTNINDIVNGTSNDAFWGNHYTFKTDSLNNSYCVINKKQPYSSGGKIMLDETLLHKGFTFLIQADIKKESSESNVSLVVEIHHNDSTIYWNATHINQQITGIDQWMPFEISSRFPASICRNNTYLKFYFYNTHNSDVQLDNFKLRITPLILPSYLPENTPSPQMVNPDTLYQNAWYTLFYSPKTQNISIADRHHQPVVQNISHLLRSKQPDDTLFYTSVNTKFQRLSTASNTFEFRSLNGSSNTHLTLQTNDNNGRISVTTHTQYKDATTVYREAIIMKYAPKTEEIYNKNRQLVTAPFNQEYWLDNQGFKAGKGDNSFTIYHPKNLSSIQLDVAHQRLIANLDYAPDHPLFHFPLLDSAINYHQDISPNTYKKRQVRENSFSFTVGMSSTYQPRIMKNPRGYLASYVFTEHGDWTDIRTQRATYFGSSAITQADSATGGFMKYRIPVTKSVFYQNPERLMNDDARFHTHFNSPIGSIMDTPGMEEFLKQIQQRGVEVCLHTPDQKTTTKKILKNALQYMQENFGSTNWIDHGYDNGIDNNREDLACDGLSKKSPYYSLKWLKKYGIKYAWNQYYEDVNAFPQCNYYSHLSEPYYGFTPAFPVPEFWQHTTGAPELWFWKTTLVLSPGNIWNYMMSTQRIEELVDNYLVCFNHTYPASIEQDNGYWTQANDSTQVVDPLFDHILEVLDSYRQRGLINLATISEVIDYRLLTRNITVQKQDADSYIVHNRGSEAINNFSMAVNAPGVMVNGKVPAHKFFKGDLIFWFNIGAGESNVITFPVSPNDTLQHAATQKNATN